MLRRHYLQQAEHSVADIEAMPPVVVGDGTVTLPHCVHPPGQSLRGSEGEEYYSENKEREKLFSM